MLSAPGTAPMDSFFARHWTAARYFFFSFLVRERLNGRAIISYIAMRIGSSCAGIIIIRWETYHSFRTTGSRHLFESLEAKEISDDSGEAIGEAMESVDRHNTAALVNPINFILKKIIRWVYKLM
jgi:hypothetical protein